MVRHTGKTARAKEDRVMMTNRCESILRHHATVLRAIFTAPGKFIPPKCNIEFPSRCFEHAHPFGHDLFADPITGDDSYAVRLHADFLFLTPSVDISGSGSKGDKRLYARAIPGDSIQTSKMTQMRTLAVLSRNRH